jgi:hypothetical protein
VITASPRGALRVGLVRRATPRYPCSAPTPRADHGKAWMVSPGRSCVAPCTTNCPLQQSRAKKMPLATCAGRRSCARAQAASDAAGGGDPRRHVCRGQRRAGERGAWSVERCWPRRLVVWARSGRRCDEAGAGRRGPTAAARGRTGPKGQRPPEPAARCRGAKESEAANVAPGFRCRRRRWSGSTRAQQRCAADSDGRAPSPGDHPPRRLACCARVPCSRTVLAYCVLCSRTVERTQHGGTRPRRVPAPAAPAPAPC